MKSREEKVKEWCAQNKLNLSDDQLNSLNELVDELTGEAYEHGLETGQESGWWQAQSTQY